MNSIPQFLIAAPTSGSGKTTVSRGLMALLSKKGLKVQPFKCGPDYIDTKYHAAVCRRPSINLDTFMASKEHVCRLYAHYAGNADVCIAEGMMGMYDGYDRDKGSSAEIAALLHLPVVLVVDAKSAAYSMAPLLSGFLHFRPDVRIAGVIFNRVGSPRHYEMLCEVCRDLGITCLGYLPKHKDLELASRYLGLDFSRSGDTEDTDLLTDLLEKHVDWKLLLEKTSFPLSEKPAEERGETEKTENTEETGQPGKTAQSEQPGNLYILVARNEESFSFIYEEHLDVLRRMGKVSFFNPEQDLPIPSDTDLLYLPGGYPEKHPEVLAHAGETLRSIRSYVEAGGRVLAECGGMIYLARSIEYASGETDGDASAETDGEDCREESLAGVFPFRISACKHRKLTLGYRSFDYNGQHLKGHEFHYTQISEKPGDALPPSVAQVYNAKGQAVDTPVFRYKNVIASYTHLYWGEINLLELF